MKVEIHELTPEMLAQLLGQEEINLDPATRVIVLNGPPGCGKDYFCNSVMNKADVMVMRFSAPMKTIVSDAAQVSWEDVTTKQDKIEFLGKTLRQHQIETFEFLEAQFGPDVLGKMLYNVIKYRLQQLVAAGVPGPMPLIVTPDGGRGPEIQFLVDKFGTDNVLIIQIERDGYSFENDIRGYVQIEGVKTVRVKNEDGDKYKADMKKVIEDWTTDWIERNKAKTDAMGMGSYDFRK